MADSWRLVAASADRAAAEDEIVGVLRRLERALCAARAAGDESLRDALLAARRPLVDYLSSRGVDVRALRLVGAKRRA